MKLKHFLIGSLIVLGLLITIRLTFKDTLSLKTTFKDNFLIGVALLVLFTLHIK